jgi:hypothetical protein
MSDGERATLAEIGKRLGRNGLQQVARIAKPDTIFGWYRKLITEKFCCVAMTHRGSPLHPETRAISIRRRTQETTQLRLSGA